MNPRSDPTPFFLLLLFLGAETASIHPSFHFLVAAIIVRALYSSFNGAAPLWPPAGGTARGDARAAPPPPPPAARRLPTYSDGRDLQRGSLWGEAAGATGEVGKVVRGVGNDRSAKEKEEIVQRKNLCSEEIINIFVLPSFRPTGFALDEAAETTRLAAASPDF